VEGYSNTTIGGAVREWRHHRYKSRLAAIFDVIFSAGDSEMPIQLMAATTIEPEGYAIV
jgi:hypothetical protein